MQPEPSPRIPEDQTANTGLIALPFTNKEAEVRDGGSSEFTEGGRGNGLREASFPVSCPLPFALRHAVLRDSSQSRKNSWASGVSLSLSSIRWALIQLPDGTLGSVALSSCLLGSPSLRTAAP